METARLPHIIAMAADEMRPAIAVRLRVNNQHGFADLRLESILARERADVALDVAARNIEVAFADVVDTIVMQELAVFIPQALAWQDHDSPAHARYGMQRRHRSARRTMV